MFKIERWPTWVTHWRDRLSLLRPLLHQPRVLAAAGGLAVLALGLVAAIQLVLGPKETVGDYVLPYVQPFDEVDLKRWFVKEGVWTLRQGVLSQTAGGDEPAQVHIPLRLIEDQPYHASVFITLKKDTRAAGLAFNSQYPDLTTRQHRVYLSRPAVDQLELVAGYMDDTGSFIPQARVPVSVNTQEFRLDLFVYDTTYLIQLNGQRLIDIRPLFYEDGLVGFFTLGAANFDNFQLTAAERPNPGDQVYVSDFDQAPGGAGWVPFGGAWQVAGGRLAQTEREAYDAGIGYETSTFQNFVLEAVFSHTVGAGGGVLFNMPSPYQLNGAAVVRYSDETDALVWGQYDAQGVFERQGFAEVAAPGTDDHTLKLFVGETSYDVFLDGQLLARDVALPTAERGHIGLITSRAAAAFARVEVYPLFAEAASPLGSLTPTATPAPKATAAPKATTAPTATAAASKTTALPTATAAAPKATSLLPAATAVPARNFVARGGAEAPYRGVFTGEFARSGWKAVRGTWTFQEGRLVQPDPLGLDSSVVYTGQAFREYSLEAGFSHLEGFGGGVLFNMPYTDRLNGAHLVRYSDRRPGAIFWGYYDETGKFVGQGYTDVQAAATDRHVLRVVSKAETYDIYLDGTRLVANLPLQSDAGYIGLLTTQSAAAYDLVSVGATDAAASAAPVTTDGFSEVRPLSGDWVTEGDTAVQQVTDLGDYVLNSGVFASAYVVEAEVVLPEGGQIGGGFLFHMPDRGSRNGAQLVRLAKGGASLLVGYYDETGQFKGQSSLALAPAARHRLRLEVGGDRVSVYLDDALVLKDFRLKRSDGWLGLTAHGGVVTFEGIRVTVAEVTGAP